MIHPGRAIGEYLGAMVLGMRLKKANRIRKRTIPSPTMFPGAAKPLRFILEELERVKHPAINPKKCINVDITYVNLHCGYSYLTLPLLSAPCRKYLNAQVLKLLAIIQIQCAYVVQFLGWVH